MNFFDTPIYITSYNRLEYLRQLIGWLEQAGYKQIHIIDNASSYPPLLDYLEHSPHRVHHMGQNYGHLALWKSGEFDKVIKHNRFVLTDCDVVPTSDCPANLVEKLDEVLNRFPTHTKIGLSLKIDDLPDHYAFKHQVLEREKAFWAIPLERGKLYKAGIDTTFAYYRPGISPEDNRWWRSIRMGPPYSARHLSWYANTSNPNEEDIYYQSHLSNGSSMWSITDPVILKEQNIKLHLEIKELQKELRLLRRSNKVAYGLIALRRTMLKVLERTGLANVIRRIRP